MNNKISLMMQAVVSTHKAERSHWDVCPGTDISSKEYKDWRVEWMKLRRDNSEAKNMLQICVGRYCPWALCDFSPAAYKTFEYKNLND